VVGRIEPRWLGGRPGRGIVSAWGLKKVDAGCCFLKGHGRRVSWKALQ
jgi:hypothetical protein